MTAPSTARDITRLLGLADDATEQQFASLAREYAVDAQSEQARGWTLGYETARGLSDLAARGVELCRAERSARVLPLLAAAAVELCPTDTAVSLDTVDGLERVTVRSHGHLVASASHRRLDVAAVNCARALLAREGAEGPACDALRGAL